MALMFSFFEGVVRKGPGSEASTLKALSMLDGLPPQPRIVDFGCGAGVASLVLARATQGNVTAVEIHQPFLQQLEALAASEGLTERIRKVWHQCAASWAGRQPLRSVVLFVTGNSYSLGELPSGSTAEATVKCTGDSHLEIEFIDDVGETKRLDAGGFFQPGCRGTIRVSIRDGMIQENEQHIQWWPN